MTPALERGGLRPPLKNGGDKMTTKKSTIVQFAERPKWDEPPAVSMHVDTGSHVELSIHNVPEEEYTKILKAVGKQHVGDFTDKQGREYRLLKMLAEVNIWVRDED
jgi:hypothetical protein